MHRNKSKNILNYYNYFSEIEETFNRRRGKFQFLSPLDWALMEDWETRGVPLHIVLRGIEKVFDTADNQAAKRKRTIKSLMYCREEIEAQYAEWNERQIGKNSVETQVETEEFSDTAIKTHLENIAAQLKDAAADSNRELRETLERATIRLSELTAKFNDSESLEKSLEDLEKIIDKALIESAEATKINLIKTEIEKQMSAYRGKMEQEVFERTFDLMLLKNLRDAANIPRLSLFYL